MSLARSLGVVFFSTLVMAGCESASDQAADEQAAKQSQVLVGWEQPELIPDKAMINDVSPSEDGLALDAKGQFEGDPKQLADAIHDSRLADGWTPELIVDQEGQYYMTYKKEGALLIYELSYNQMQRLITISYLPAEPVAG